MNFLRANISRAITVSLICIGISLAAVQPAKAGSSSRNFAMWFQSIANTADADAMKQELASLRKAHKNIRQLLQEASEIISRHNDTFNLPVSPSPESESLQHMLLIGWNQFQTGNAMAATPAPSVAKPAMVSASYGHGPGGLPSGLMPGVASYGTPMDSRYSRHPLGNGFRDDVMPLVDGIAIGAP